MAISSTIYHVKFFTRKKLSFYFFTFTSPFVKGALESMEIGIIEGVIILKHYKVHFDL